MAEMQLGHNEQCCDTNIQIAMNLTFFSCPVTIVYCLLATFVWTVEAIVKELDSKRVAPAVHNNPSQDFMPFIGLCDPGHCVNTRQKQQLQSCIGKDLMSIFHKCTLSGAEECDASSARIIRTCFARKSHKLVQSAKIKDCHKLLNDASIKCMTKNWNRSITKASSDAIRELPMPKLRGQREIEFS